MLGEVEEAVLHEVGKDDRIFECARHPYQIQRILIHRHLPRQRTSIVAAQERPSVRVYADTEVSYPHLQSCSANDIRYRRRYPWVYLCGIEDWRI